MTCYPVSELLQVFLSVAFFICLCVSILMYLDGYWTLERVEKRKDEKWIRNNPFQALDREYLGYGRYKRK